MRVPFTKTLPKTLILIILFSYSLPSNASTLTTAGNIGQFALPISALLTTFFYHDEEGTIQFMKSYIVTMSTVYSLKPLINCKRPDGNKWSFPSGHTASAFAGAGFLQRRYGWWYGVPAYTFASIVGFSRIEAKRHWVQDVLTGAAIGVSTNLIFTTKYSRISIEPVIDQEMGIRAQVTLK